MTKYPVVKMKELRNYTIGDVVRLKKNGKLVEIAKYTSYTGSCKRYSPSATDSYLYENGEVQYWQFAKKHGVAFISVPQKKFVVFIAEDITFPDHWEGGDFTLLTGGVLVDNGDNSVYGINPVEFWNTHERN